MSVFVDVGDDLLLGVRWICVCSVIDCALDSDASDCFEFVCIGDDVADLGVVRSEDGLEVDGGTYKDCFVFSAERDVLDDLFDLFVVPDVVGGAEVVEFLSECSVMIVLVVSDVMEPGYGDGVEHEMT